MLDQNFSAFNLKKLVTFRDLVRHNIGRNKSEIEAKIKEISEEINDDGFQIMELSRKVSDPEVFLVTRLQDVFALKKLNDNLLRIYKVKQSNRHLIIRQIMVLLKETMPMSIIRLDIKQFYKSVDKGRILKKLNQDSLLSYKSKKILNTLFESSYLINEEGLPRGLNISATMSEIYMRDFDEDVRRLHGVYYYARYVDDIIIFCHCDSDFIIKKIIELLSKEKLQLNLKKKEILERISCKCKWSCKCKTTKTLTFDYLGYQFSFSNISGVSGELKISLANKKVKKIKTRVIKSFLAYLKDKDYALLKDRISLLTSNYIIKSNESGNLKAGIYYNYPFMDKDADCLNELTSYIRKVINAKAGAFGKRLRKELCSEKRRELIKYDFVSGYADKRICDYTINEIKTIRKCWIYG